jgi:hypothetical protein
VAKIISCPFCGELPTIDPIDWKAEGDAWAAVTCENDECPVKPSLHNWANTALSGAKGSLAQKRVAIRKWNACLKTHAQGKGE